MEVTPAPPQPARPAARAVPPPPVSAPGDPAHVFDSMKGGPLFGVLLLDRRGLVLAGSLGDPQSGQADELGAILGSAIDEAMRAVTHLSLGTWQGLLLDCETAALHVTPIGTEALVVVAAHREAPAGWLLRTAAHAASLAERFVGVYS
jgi:predicted regulator of Ras-like GTPase activity (Roadblock/LC7/MglB family)